jgi:hypothetical protein
VPFDGDPAIGCITANNARDLIDTVATVACQIGTVELKVDIGQIYRYTAAGFLRLDILFAQFFNKRAVLLEFNALLVDGFLLFFLTIFLPLKLVADQGATA